MAYIGPSPTLPGSVNTTDIEDSAVTAIKLGSNNQPGSSGQLLSTDGSGGLSWATDAGMVYPGAGIPLSTGSAWGTSFTAPSSALVGLTDTQTLTNKTLTAPIINSLSALSVVNNVVVGGNLTVNGTTTTIDSQTLSVKDKNIEMGVVSSPSDATADGGGLTLKGATDKTFNWVDSTDAWTSSEHIKLASGKTFIGDGSTLTALNATNLGSGTIPDARFPATLPAASGANLTALNGSNISSGTIAAARVATLNQNTTGTSGGFTAGSASNLNAGTLPDARFPATLPTASGANLTALNASNLGSGTVNVARLGSGATSSKFLRGDNTWQTIPSTSPGGSNTQFQYNNSGSFAGISALTTDGTDITFVGTGGSGGAKNAIWDASASSLAFDDWAYLTFNSTFQIYRGTGAATIVDTSGSGMHMAINGGIEIRAYTTGEKYIKATENGATELYYDGTKRIETSNTGVTITGIATATTFSGSGASLTTLNASNISSGTVATGRLGTGSAGTGTFLRGDSSWAAVTISSVNGNTLGGTDAGSVVGSSATDNTFFGYQSGKVTNTGDENTAIGHNSLVANTTGSRNVAVGKEAGFKSIGGTQNTFVGFGAGYENTYGDFNTALGGFSLALSGSALSGDYNTCLGYYAGAVIVGEKNTCVGAESGKAITNTYGNVHIGYQAGMAVTTGTNNVCIGHRAGEFGVQLTTGYKNIIIGPYASASSATVDNEVTIGQDTITKFRIPGINFILKDNGGTPSSGQILTADGSGEGYWATPAAGGGTTLNTTSNNLYTSISGNSNGGTYNISLGKDAGDSLASGGNYNTLLGYNSGKDLSTGSYNILLGNGVAEHITTGMRNIGIGPFCMMDSTITGTDNVAIGNSALRQLTSGTYNTAIGPSAGYYLTSASDNTFIGRSAGNNLTTGTYNAIVGAFAGFSHTTGGSNSIFGYGAGYSITTGEKNTCLGRDALRTETSGTKNTVIGYQAGYSQTAAAGSADENVFIGHQAAYNFTNGIKNIAIGSETLNGSGTGKQYNIAIGFWSLKAITTGTNNIGLGVKTGVDLTTATYNVLLGDKAGYAITTGPENICVGRSAGNAVTTGSTNLFIGKSAGSTTTTGYGNIVLGETSASSATVNNECTIGSTSLTKFRVPGINFIVKDNGGTPSSGQILTADASGEGYWADGVARSRAGNSTTVGFEAGNSLTSTAYNNTLVGYRAGDSINTGDDNTCIGYYAGEKITSGEDNISIGSYTGYALTTGKYNTALGNYAAYKVATGESNTFLGYYAGFNNTVNNNVGIGSLAMYSVTTGANNTCIGYQAGQSGANDLTTGSNNILIGYNAAASSTTVSNEISFGDSAITKFRIPGINFVIKDTTATDNYVLTVDSNGEAGWEAAAGGGPGTGESYVKLTNGGTLANNGVNTFAGLYTGNNLNTGAEYNTSFGWKAGEMVTTADNNSYFGANAGTATTTGGNNTAIGSDALKANTTGNHNVAVGHKALEDTTTGVNNVFMGYNAGKDITTGGYNTGMGGWVMHSATGNYNTCMGYAAGGNLSSGSDNTCIGYDSGKWLGSGSYNTGLGMYSLWNTTGNNNTSIGYQAGGAQTSGNSNTLIGYKAGYSGTNNLTTGSNNLIIGYEAAASSATVSNEITLGNTSITKFRVPGLNFELTPGIITLKNNGAQSEVRWYCETSNAHYASLKAPAHADFSGNLTFTIPSGYGSSGQFLQSNGSGGTTWANASGGGLSHVVQDTSPQLGGNLDMQSNNISGTGTITATSVSNTAAGMRKITASTSAPSGGSDGDLWVVYS